MAHHHASTVKARRGALLGEADGDIKKQHLIDKGRVTLLRSEELPSWYRRLNMHTHLKIGYRPVLAVPDCFESWLYLHNQSVNIYSHLLPALVAAGINVVFSKYFEHRFPEAPRVDRLVIHLYLTTSCVCFGLSSLFHTLLCHSEEYADLWVRMDFLGISIQIIGSVVPSIYIGFYCEPSLRSLYISLITILGGVTAFFVVHPRFRTLHSRAYRLVPFMLLGLSAVIPIIHGAMIFPYSQLVKQASLNYYYAECAFMLIGIWFLLSQFPERWKPGMFDYFGASHQIFHFLIVIGVLCHFKGILSALEWTYAHRHCESA